MRTLLLSQVLVLAICFPFSASASQLGEEFVNVEKIRVYPDAGAPDRYEEFDAPQRGIRIEVKQNPSFEIYFSRPILKGQIKLIGLRPRQHSRSVLVEDTQTAVFPGTTSTGILRRLRLRPGANYMLRVGYRARLDENSPLRIIWRHFRVKFTKPPVQAGDGQAQQLAALPLQS